MSPRNRDRSAPTSLPHRPGLDGLRGLAVAAVVAYHLGYGWAGGGFLGVSLFFTLSGYLVTSLLLAEHDVTGRVSLRSFWARRARRILPASRLTLAGVVLVARARPTAPGLAGDVRAALGQVANWRFVLAHRSYADSFSDPSPLKHLWSLAIEEQCYLLLPLVAVVALRRGRRVLALVLGGLCVASVGAQVVLRHAPFDRIYQGTDTRAAELLVGALAACMLSPRRLAGGRAGRAARVSASAAAGSMIVLWAGTRLGQPWLRNGGLAVAALVNVAVVLVGAGPLGHRLFGWRPLAALGRVSYGVYLYHWPLVVWLTPARTGLSWPAVDALRVAGTLALATLSYRFVERPVRARALPARVSLRLGVYAFSGVLVASVLVPAAAPAGAAAVLARYREEPLPTVASITAGMVARAAPAAPTTQLVGPVFASPVSSIAPRATPPLAAAAPAPTLAAAPTLAVAPTLAATTVPEPTTVPVTAAPTRPLLWLVGDSVPYSLAPALATAADDRGADVVDLAVPACDGARGYPTTRIELGPEDTETRPACLAWEERWPQFAAAREPAAVLFVLGGNVTLDRRIDGAWRSPCDAVFRDWYEPEVLARVDWVSDHTGAVPLLTLSPWAEDRAVGVLQRDHRHRTDCVNDIYRDVAAQRPQLRLVDLQSFVCPDGHGAPCQPWRQDGLHFVGQGAGLVADWLLGQVWPPPT